MNEYRGSRFNGQGHGFGCLKTNEWTHTGWFESGRPFGFGIRHYPTFGQLDIGLWEDRYLVKLALALHNGLKYQLNSLIGENFMFLEDDGIDFDEFLKIPKYPCHTFKMPSKSSLLVISEQDVREAKYIHSTLESDIVQYTSNKRHIPVETEVLEEKKKDFESAQTEHAKDIIDKEDFDPLREFWISVLLNNTLNGKDVKMLEELEVLLSNYTEGPKTRQIMATFRAVENSDINCLLALLRNGVHVGSRDLTNYSLVHCASIFSNIRALNVLLKSGSLFLTSFHFTPLNLVLLLYYREKLRNIVTIKKTPTVTERVQISHRNGHQSINKMRPKSAMSNISSHESGYDSLSSSQYLGRPQSACHNSTYTVTPERPSSAKPRAITTRPHSARPRSARPRSARPPSAQHADDTTTNDDLTEDLLGLIPCSNFDKPRNYRRVIKLLINNGVPKYHIQCAFVLPEMFWPVLANDPDMVDDLLLAGCNCHMPVVMNGLQTKCIHLSTETHPDIVSSLIASRANPDEKMIRDDRENPKFEFTFSAKLIDGGNSNALVRCIVDGKKDHLYRIVESGADIITCHQGYTPLGLAILHGHIHVAKLLLENGADPNAIQKSGGTPLGLVLHPQTDARMTLRDKVALVDMLIEYGANITTKFKMKKTTINTIDFITQMLHPTSGPPPISGFFGSLGEEEKRNYLARAELMSYIVSSAREQLDKLSADGDATTACFECGQARKKLTVDTHFKVIAFCGARCRKVFWRSNPSRLQIKPRKRRKFQFESFYMKTNLKDNYSYN